MEKATLGEVAKCGFGAYLFVDDGGSSVIAQGVGLKNGNIKTGVVFGTLEARFRC